MEGLPVKEWRRESFLVSTDVSLIDMEALNSALASDSMPWAVGLPEDLLLTALRSSLCLGLYHYPEKGNHEGMLVTDNGYKTWCPPYPADTDIFLFFE